MTDAVLGTTMSTPVGNLALLVHNDGLVAAGFSDVHDQYSRLRNAPPLRLVEELGRFTDAMTAYFAGDVSAMETLPVGQPGGAFRQAAWKVMREVPPGEVITYSELAARAGNPRAVRAAGSACAQNLVAPIVPCHRIVRTGGNLGGYYYGLDVKSWLLEHERRSLTRG
ncbi:MAG TPA: methylated-DNA--[protein]-cysteine S-methyltransferase [Mycobacteriales bacterium]|jgi:methylated-DNA-[protein]-cysteine S-methyltransferase|nr:methylated-DNA--[protein]-cysteine S-methyltransferase [Mycobacteriales bacterium]